MMLSTLTKVENSNLTLEQYPTGSELAADMICTAASLGDVEGKMVVDLGCGNGILGLGSFLLGAREVIFVDVDKEAIDVARENYTKLVGIRDLVVESTLPHNDQKPDGSPSPPLQESASLLGIEKDLKGSALFFNCDILEISLRCDTVIMNPPFGSRKRHADRQFLLKAFQIAPTVYSLHKRGNLAYLEGVSEEFRITNVWEKKIKIERMFEFHKRKRIEVEVNFVRFCRNL